MKKSIGFRFDLELIERLKALAGNDGRSLNNLVENVLEKWASKQSREDKVGTITKMLERIGARNVNGEWRLYIMTGGAPVTLNDREREWNRKGGRPIGKDIYEAIEWIDSNSGMRGGLDEYDFDAEEIAFARACIAHFKG